ncbi:hypothetical protein M7I_7120 [Glarea lozoyensis 74030]|uniref:Uncharacterized protein n=1 Tax=Glarea lozoyensis (strain ATCC 74030 / MF5533) TaxID=1104152 RepID=H0EWF5_GLAL7|nr:hypothetical protein M7I_7120 [Glarea lozoyensis 74030]
MLTRGFGAGKGMFWWGWRGYGSRLKLEFGGETGDFDEFSGFEHVPRVLRERGC